MTNDSFHQRRPDRRFRRLLPAAVAAVTLASSAPFLGPSVAHAHGTPRQERREHVKPQPAGKIPATLRVDTTRGIRVEGTAAT